MIKDEEGRPTDINEQKDVFEFFNLFMDRLENEVSGSEHKNFIKKIFGGTICNQLICKGCPHSSQTDELFLGKKKNKKLSIFFYINEFFF